MPYYFGEGSPGWDEYMERVEAEMRRPSAEGPMSKSLRLIERANDRRPCHHCKVLEGFLGCGDTTIR